MTNERSTAVRVFCFALAFALVLGVIFAALLGLQYRWDWKPVWSYRELLLDGWFGTLGISAIALPASCVVGLALAFARRSGFLPLHYMARIIVEITRGAPLLVQIYLYFYVFANALHLHNRYVVGPLTLAVFTGAYISEIIRAGIESVGRSQIETARAIGLTARQTYRFVIFPQAIRQILPALAGQFVSLVKDSSLLSILSIAELTKAASDVNSYTFGPFESSLPLALGYLVITLPISLWTQSLEQRAKFDT
jgi:polar amino acid transport system permease protein